MSNENCLYILQNAEATDDFDSKNSWTISITCGTCTKVYLKI
jgi:hypothetical protein